MTITLEQKFESLETQLTTQHGEVIEALNSILTALGAPPPGPTTTLEDIGTLLGTVNTNLLAVQSDNAAFYAAALEVFGLINTNTDTIITNNSLNAQRLLQAIYSTACQCPTPTDLIAPPTDVTPTSLVDEEKCKRIQFYLSVFGNWLTKIANYGSAAGFVTGDTLGTLLGLAASEAGIVATGAEVGAAAGPPGVVIGAVVGLIMGAIFIFGGSILVDYANQFNSPTMQHALLEAMFAATNADEGYTAFKTTILAHMDAVPAQIIYTLWWSAWSNDVYSGVPTVDDSAFDGSICVPRLIDITTCTTYTAESITTSGHTYYAVIVPPIYSPNPIYIEGDYFGWTFEELTGHPPNGVIIYYLTGSGDPHVAFTLTPGGGGNGLAAHTLAIAIFTADYDSNAYPFTIEICPPA